MIYISFFGLLLQLLLFCSISVALSLVVKNEIVSILASILLLYGLENIVSSGVTYWTSTGDIRLFLRFSGYQHMENCRLVLCLSPQWVMLQLLWLFL
jgi:ABC-type transport system involved in multi-copper enzyme maturation permease subunit